MTIQLFLPSYVIVIYIIFYNIVVYDISSLWIAEKYSQYPHITQQQQQRKNSCFNIIYSFMYSINYWRVQPKILYGLLGYNMPKNFWTIFIGIDLASKRLTIVKQNFILIVSHYKLNWLNFIALLKTNILRDSLNHWIQWKYLL